MTTRLVSSLHLMIVLAVSLTIRAGEPLALRFDRLSVEKGLSQSTVYAIIQDHRGFMWFGTQNGLNRFDGYEVEVYRHNAEDSASLASSYVYALFEDTKQRLWVGTSGGGLNRYDPSGERFIAYRHDLDQPGSISHNIVTAITEGWDGALWIGTHGGGLNRFDPERPEEGFRVFASRFDDPQTLSEDKIWAIYADRARMGPYLWIATEGGGLNRLDPATGLVRRFQHDRDQPDSLGSDELWALTGDLEGRLWIGSLGAGLDRVDFSDTEASPRFHHYRSDPAVADAIASDLVLAAYQDRQGMLWFGLADGGLSRLDPDDIDAGSFQTYRHDPDDPTSLSSDTVSSIYEDRTGCLWVGTYNGGVNRVNLHAVRLSRERGRVFRAYRHRLDEPESLSTNQVTAFARDRSGRVWVGTDGGGLEVFAPGAEPVEGARFARFRYDANDPSTLRGNVIKALLVDREDRLWVGTLGAGLASLALDGFDPWQDSAGFTHYRYDPRDPASLASDTVEVLYQDRAGALWIGTNKGLDLTDPSNPGEMVHYQHDPEDDTTLSHDVVSAFIEDPRGLGLIAWVGTHGGGLNRLEQSSGRFTRFANVLGEQSSLSNNIVYSLLFDDARNLWIGTGGGLNMLAADQTRAENPRFRVFGPKHGLSGETVYGICSDARGYLWMSTIGGLSRFDPGTETFTNYTVADGLAGNEHRPGAYLATADGVLYFGGTKGFTRFSPAAVRDNEVAPQVVLTQLAVHDRVQLPPRFQSDSVLDAAIEETAEVRLAHDQNRVSIRFAGLHYGAPDQRRASWTLPPGSYTFRVKAANKDGVWNEEGAGLRIVVSSPPWMSWWAWTLYLLAGTGIVAAFLYAYRRKLEKERAINERLRQVDRLKDDFLANTSHELRTPLNGIIGLTESLLDGAAGELGPRVQSTLRMISGSGRRLAGLVDNILDFAKLENRGLDLDRKAVDLQALTDVVFSLSRPLICRKELTLISRIPAELPAVLADENRLLQVMHNLVGNAIKFTERGRVEVTAVQKGVEVEVRVSDTGIGIPEEMHARIFHGFEQADGSTRRVHGGTGLGLTISKQLIELHGGRIGVDSRIAEGSTFYFTLPVFAEQSVVDGAELDTLPPLEIRPEPIADLEDGPGPEPVVVGGGDASFRILVVDDDPVNRHVLVNHLALAEYRIVEAGSGFEALEAVEIQGAFDLVILDVMMPRMTGYEVALNLRKSHNVHELPIIFLTAKNQVEDLVTAFDAGANDFLTKPVNKHELLSRVRTHLRLLDITRNLERKVEERTRELAAKQVDLIESQKELVSAAHNAGMAEIASGVLHNVGNTLNSVQTSAQMVHEILHGGRADLLFQKIKNLIVSEAELERIARDDVRRRELVGALELIGDKLIERRELLYQENLRMLDHIRAIKTVLAEQREYSRMGAPVLAETDLEGLIDETIQMKIYLFEDKRVDIVREPGEIPPVRVEPTRFKRMLFYLLDNAREAIEEHREPGSGRIVLRTTCEEGAVRVEIIDNGIGIQPEHLTKVFTQGFSTKKSFRGFGLHYCANAVKEMGGSIEIDSAGVGKGVAVALIFPFTADRLVGAT